MAAHQALDDVANVGALIGRDVQLMHIIPAAPVGDEDLTKAVAAEMGWGMEKHRRLAQAMAVQGMSQTTRFSGDQLRDIIDMGFVRDGFCITYAKLNPARARARQHT
ncbi:MAG TPA: hypothetical protein VI793_04585 [Anaerolineales bacterium]|nr:hypothetical protein [Anaerolineales bacterium]